MESKPAMRVFFIHDGEITLATRESSSYASVTRSSLLALFDVRRSHQLAPKCLESNRDLCTSKILGASFLTEVMCPLRKTTWSSISGKTRVGFIITTAVCATKRGPDSMGLRAPCSNRQGMEEQFHRTREMTLCRRRAKRAMAMSKCLQTNSSHEYKIRKCDSGLWPNKGPHTSP